MAEASSSIFNKQATERLRSPDDLDRYVRVTSPSVWVATLSVLVLLAGLLCWAVFGSVTASVSCTGAAVDGQFYCMVEPDAVSKVSEGDQAYVNGQRATVKSISELPLSREEALGVFGADYLVDVLMPGESKWAYAVVLEGVQADSGSEPVSVSITTERVAPISLVLGDTK